MVDKACADQGGGDADRHLHPDDPGVGARYVASPTRTPAGYRLYDEQSIARLKPCAS